MNSPDKTPIPPLRVGERVRFSVLGRGRVREMPEAWGLHTALTRGEVGEVVEAVDAAQEAPAVVSVEFPSGGAYYWDAACFERADDAAPRPDPPD